MIVKSLFLEWRRSVAIEVMYSLPSINETLWIDGNCSHYLRDRIQTYREALPLPQPMSNKRVGANEFGTLVFVSERMRVTIP